MNFRTNAPYILVASILITLAMACGSESSTETKSETYTYELTENQCPTGKHEFSSKDAYCDGLTQSKLNNYCAYNLRKMEFERERPGKNWTTRD